MTAGTTMSGDARGVAAYGVAYGNYFSRSLSRFA